MKHNTLLRFRNGLFIVSGNTNISFVVIDYSTHDLTTDSVGIAEMMKVTRLITFIDTV